MREANKPYLISMLPENMNCLGGELVPGEEEWMGGGGLVRVREGLVMVKEGLVRVREGLVIVREGLVMVREGLVMVGW